MSDIQKKFEKNGYVVVPADKKLIDEIRNQIFLTIKSNFKKREKNSIDFLLNNFHKFIKTKDFNKIRFNAYNKFNTKKFSEIYYLIAKKYLDGIVGNELSMQKKNKFINTNTKR